jgi:hypothetical protein
MFVRLHEFCLSLCPSRHSIKVANGVVVHSAASGLACTLTEHHWLKASTGRRLSNKHGVHKCRQHICCNLQKHSRSKVNMLKLDKCRCCRCCWIVSSQLELGLLWWSNLGAQYFVRATYISVEVRPNITKSLRKIDIIKRCKPIHGR